MVDLCRLERGVALIFCSHISRSSTRSIINLRPAPSLSFTYRRCPAMAVPVESRRASACKALLAARLTDIRSPTPHPQHQVLKNLRGTAFQPAQIDHVMSLLQPTEPSRLRRGPRCRSRRRRRRMNRRMKMSPLHAPPCGRRVDTLHSHFRFTASANHHSPRSWLDQWQQYAPFSRHRPPAGCCRRLPPRRTSPWSRHPCTRRRWPCSGRGWRTARRGCWRCYPST